MSRQTLARRSSGNSNMYLSEWQSIKYLNFFPKGVQIFVFNPAYREFPTIPQGSVACSVTGKRDQNWPCIFTGQCNKQNQRPPVQSCYFLWQGTGEPASNGNRKSYRSCMPFSQSLPYKTQKRPTGDASEHLFYHRRSEQFNRIQPSWVQERNGPVWSSIRPCTAIYPWTFRNKNPELS